VTAATLALEAMMLHPRYPELAERLRALTPTGLLDQADAAATDAYAILAAGAEHLGAKGVSPALAASVPGWIRLGVIDALTSYVNGSASTCPHNPDPARPQPVLTAAWRPGLVVCRLCTHLLALPRQSAADRTCDGCGYVCAGADDEDPIYPSMVQLGPVVYQYGACTRCNPATTSAGPLSATLSQDPGNARGTGTTGTRATPRGRRGRGRRTGRRTA